MSLLNNLWSLLTTKNELATQIISTIPIFVEAWLVFKILSSFLQFDYNNKQKYAYILLFPIISIIFKFFVPSPFNTFINYITMFILIKLIFKVNWLKCIIGTILPTIIFALVNTLLLKPFLVIFKLTYDEIESIPLYRIIYLFIVYTVVYFIVLLIQKNKFKSNLKEDFSKENRLIILINLLLGFFTLCLQLIIAFLYTDVLPAIFGFLSFLSLLAYFFISIHSLIKTLKLQITTRDLENAENYNKTLSILYDNVKAFKHDFDNMIFTIGGFVNTDDMEDLKKYYYSLEKDCQKVNNIALLNPCLINNPGIYNLLTAKYQKATDENVEIQLDFFFDLNKLHMPIYDFSRIIGILIDNGIEAASETDAKLVKITFHDSPASHIQIFTIENSYNNKDVDKNKIFEKGITGKENHSGMGLWEVSQILNRNNNSKLITEPSELLFKQRLEIYY